METDVAGLGLGDFLVDLLINRFPQIERRDGQFIPLRRIGITRQEIEESRRIDADEGIGRQDADIRIDTGRLAVVVARRQVDVTADAIFFTADDEGNLGVGLEAHDAVNDMAAGFFQLAGHVDIIFFIETGLDFHEDRDLLAIFCRLGQGRDDRRLAADAV